jgi:hypothetical protein
MPAENAKRNLFVSSFLQVKYTLIIALVLNVNTKLVKNFRLCHHLVVAGLSLRKTISFMYPSLTSIPFISSLSHSPLSPVFLTYPSYFTIPLSFFFPFLSPSPLH